MCPHELPHTCMPFDGGCHAHAAPNARLTTRGLRNGRSSCTAGVRPGRPGATSTAGHSTLRASAGPVKHRSYRLANIDSDIPGEEPRRVTMRPKNSVRSMLKGPTTTIRGVQPDASANFPYVRPTLRRSADHLGVRPCYRRTAIGANIIRPVLFIRLLPLNGTGSYVETYGRLVTTHRSRRRFSQRTTGLPWNLIFADAAEKVRVGGSGQSQVAITNLGKVPAERLHPKAAYSHCPP